VHPHIGSFRSRIVQSITNGPEIVQLSPRHASNSMSATELLNGMNPSQAQAVQHIDGPLLMLAGPGSGKTRVITHRIAYMIDQGIDPRQIVGLTFTNKAAEEMRQRLQRLVGRSDVWLGTFHGFCVRLLRRYARLVGLPENFSIYDVDDAQAALKAAVGEAKFELTHVSLATLASRISYFKNRLVTPDILQAETLSSQEYQVAQVYPAYQQYLLRNAAVDFDDILLHTALLLRSHTELRQELDERLRYVMVDEYQDTNLAQYVIVRHLCVDHPNLAATGDPDQSIYGWRGANLKNVSYLERDFPDLHTIRLEQNYRSTPEILSVADVLIQHNEFRKAKVLVPSRATGNQVQLVVYPTASEEAEDIANQIQALTNAGEYRLSDFGVLVRTNAHSRLIERALLRRQLNYQLIGGFRFYLRKEIKDLVSYLVLINNPEDGIAVQRAINIPPRGIGKKTVDKLEEFARQRDVPMLEACRQAVQGNLLSSRASTALKGFLKIYDSLCAIAHGPLLDLLQSTIEMIGYRDHLLKQNTGDDESDLFRNLDELLAEAREIDAEEDERSALERFLEFAALQADTDRLNNDRDLVTVMTLHAAKGLEFACVYIMAVEENVLPHSRSKDDPMQLEEERRLLFVGITRAKDRLQLSYAKSRGFSSQGSGVPSSFLMELPRGEMQIIDRTDQGFDFDDGGGSFDEYFDRDDQGWDDACQLPRHEEACADAPADDPVYIDAGDECQLPPDERQQRLQRTRQTLGNLNTRGLGGSGRAKRLHAASGSNPASGGLAKWAAYKPGAAVQHPRFGGGEIIAASGFGPKRSVTIRFEIDGSERTFRLSHVELELR
jgi:DNA helicase II / ATP-dependent DNA helicase PcrA